MIFKIINLFKWSFLNQTSGDFNVNFAPQHRYFLDCKLNLK